MWTFVVFGLFASISVVSGQAFSDLRFYWGSLPYKADTSTGLVRGDQHGYNICNSTTEGPTSLCQTAIINSLDDFCIWGPPIPNSNVGATEGEMLAWCTQPGHGTRVMVDGTITGVQFTRAPDYIQVVGFMDQTKINIAANDSGGEMDPHGADNRGNPIGGLVFSNAFNGTYTQAVEWHNFNGAGIFCLKACDPRGSRPHDYCQNMYDTFGCGFNAPSNARPGVFESCRSDNQNPPGQGVGVPASSECSTFASTDIYGARATVQVPIPGASTISFSSTPQRPRPTASSLPASSGGSRTSSGSLPTNTTSGTMRINVGLASATSILAVILTMMLLA